eukprot:CAMPEP_0185850760 /NCGR_PEP_ID=MMETSP1354-20130828/4776_1 /TAXON_ID=708628 /ORGANISM="Erythrolobus madagascarensis, Strain CCMP3276" /LENGTH=567 /DNA_ID=CAMNT_0028551477 /DNA_START=72 /DNA_END=1775 /DNA_ORIENTATION=+
METIGSSFGYLERMLADDDVRSWLRYENAEDVGDLSGQSLPPEALSDAHIFTVYDRSLGFETAPPPLMARKGLSLSSVSGGAARVEDSTSGSEEEGIEEGDDNLHMRPSTVCLVHRVRSRGSLHFGIGLLDSKKEAFFVASGEQTPQTHQRFMRGVMDGSHPLIKFAIFSMRKPDGSWALDVSITSPLMRMLGETFVFSANAFDEEPFLASRLRSRLLLVSSMRRELNCEFCQLRYGSKSLLMCTCSSSMLGRQNDRAGDQKQDQNILSTALSSVQQGGFSIGSSNGTYATFADFLIRFRSAPMRRHTVVGRPGVNFGRFVLVSESALLARHSVTPACDVARMRALLLHKIFARWSVDRMAEAGSARNLASNSLSLPDSNSKRASSQSEQDGSSLKRRRVDGLNEEDVSNETELYAAEIPLSERKGLSERTSKGFHEESALWEQNHSSSAPEPKKERKRACLAESTPPASEPVGTACHSKYACDLCGAKFQQVSHLKAHYAQVHVGSYEYECPECRRQFKTVSNRNQHLKLVHGNERLFKCKLCPSSFKSNSKLRRHQLHVHSQDSP